MLDLLAPLGFTVMGAAGGVDCLAMAAQWRPISFLLDLAMPDMTGWDVARALQDDAARTRRSSSSPPMRGSWRQRRAKGSP